MKYTKTHHKTIPQKALGGGLSITMLALMLVISACSDSSLLNPKQEQQAKEEISKIDGKPIMKIDAADLYHTDRFNKYVHTLAAKNGPAIIRALKEKSNSLRKYQTASVAVKNLKNYGQPILTGKKAEGSSSGANISSLADVGSELQMKDSDGEVEKFVMTLHPYVPHPAKESSRQVVQRIAGSANNNSSVDTYLALDPDFFYVHDNSNGEENYPITFPAVSLNDSTKKMMVTATRKANGKVVFHFNQSDSAPGSARSAVNTSSGNQPNLVFAEATPVVAPNFIAPTPGGGGSGGGGGGGGGSNNCQEVDNRGGDTGGTPTAQAYYFNINKVRLWATGDGDGAAELQMFVKNDDNYEYNCFPGEYKYRFDNVRDWTGAINHIIQGADNQDYAIADVNHADYTYNVAYEDTYYSQTRPFPLFNLTNHPGPWRLVLVDDDKDYKDFATNHVHAEPYYKDVQTYDMSNGQWSEVHTGFTTTEKTNGNSDDPIQESGVRRITKANVNDRLGYYGQSITAMKQYSNGRFSYEFSVSGY